MRRPDCDRICGNELLVFEHAEHICFDVDLYGDISSCATFARSWRLDFRLIFNFVRRLRGSFAAGLNIFYRREFEWLNVWDRQLIARFDAFQLAGVKLFKEMSVAVKFFRNGVSGIAIRQKLQLCLRTYVARQLSNALQVRFGNGVWNEHGLHAAEIETVDVRRESPFCVG